MVAVVAVLGFPAGWAAARVAARVLEARDEGLPPVPSWAAPATAVAGIGVFAVVTGSTPGGWLLPAYLWFAAVTMTLAVTDVHSRLIPDRISFPGTYVGAILLAIGAVVEGSGADLGRAAAGAGIYVAVTLVLYIPGGGRSFGFGDVKLSPLLGLFTAFVAWDSLAVAVMLGILIGGVTGVALLVTRAKGLQDHFAFGPPMILAAHIAVGWGEEIMAWYVG